MLGFGRLLHFRTDRRSESGAAIGPHGALAKQGVVGWQFFHLGYNGFAIAIGLQGHGAGSKSSGPNIL
jgi:hypothetical protein